MVRVGDYQKDLNDINGFVLLRDPLSAFSGNCATSNGDLLPIQSELQRGRLCLRHVPAPFRNCNIFVGTYYNSDKPFVNNNRFKDAGCLWAYFAHPALRRSNASDRIRINNTCYVNSEDGRGFLSPPTRCAGREAIEDREPRASTLAGALISPLTSATAPQSPEDPALLPPQLHLPLPR
ncbi:unnamed protein product, partial [Iphiclides podalirius]